ncbi:winged helix-turn-helix domain-containing protein [Jatrophihabitans endophyticus]|uniref:winged helix-turn-helix domain-containing protein n=1 Tax=Jatrophihabitans endophyticus TaxID=1206085 RepID=UPI000934DF6D|nr:crosslink repair DNA glycosylase YcaQ family protein [Jatrophihabitans endophyticus]
MAGVRTLSAAHARRIALAAQGFADPRPTGRVDARHVRRVLDRVALLQIDSVNVFSRSHYLPVFARLGPYPREVLDRMTAYVPRPRHPELFEYWAHAASLVPVRYQPLLRWRMARAHVEPWANIRRIARERPGLLDDVRRLVAEQGPIVAGDTGIPRPAPRPGHMWNWHDGKTALEWLFFAGEITTAKRVNFERWYDLAERVIPADVLAAPTPDPVDAKRELVRISARAHGVATEPDLRDYFRLSHADTKAAVAELVDTGELAAVHVAGWDAPAYLWHEARRPRTVQARALLSPFDSLVWYRERTLRLFDFHYRIEIYTREEERRYGYYVLPFLLGDTLVGRVDLKADRQQGVLRVQSAWVEPGQDPGHVAIELAAELDVTAGWLGLDGVEVMPRGDLSTTLAEAVARTGPTPAAG